MAEHGVIYTRLMNSSEWRAIRQRQLYKQPYCEECIKHGVVRCSPEPMVVHHIVEVENGRTEEEQRALAYAETTYLTDEHGAVVYDPAPHRLSGNLATMCVRCHNKHHAEMKSHSRKVHQERNEARLASWIARQKGTS